MRCGMEEGLLGSGLRGHWKRLAYHNVWQPTEIHSGEATIGENRQHFIGKWVILKVVSSISH